MKQSAELLKQRTTDAAVTALEKIAEGLSISSYSEKLLEMKAEALFMVCMISMYYFTQFFSLSLY